MLEIRRIHSEENKPTTNSLTYEILRSGWLEILISLLSIAVSSIYDSTNAICWFNLFRLSFITNFFILELPQIEVLLSGIYSGLRSIVSTWFLLIITFVIYGVLTTACFRDNDPARFSTVGTSMFTLFRISTMDNWSTVNYINAYGCDKVQSEYIVISKNDTTPRYVDVLSGRMYLFLCDSPTAHPYLSSLIFTSFVVLTGFMLISLTVAAVSGGVHMRLEQIQKMQKEEEMMKSYDMNPDYFLEEHDDDNKPTIPTESNRANQRETRKQSLFTQRSAGLGKGSAFSLETKESTNEFMKTSPLYSPNSLRRMGEESLTIDDDKGNKAVSREINSREKIDVSHFQQENNHRNTWASEVESVDDDLKYSNYNVVNYLEEQKDDDLPAHRIGAVILPTSPGQPAISKRDENLLDICSEIQEFQSGSDDESIVVRPVTLTNHPKQTTRNTFLSTLDKQSLQLQQQLQQTDVVVPSPASTHQRPKSSSQRSILTENAECIPLSTDVVHESLPLLQDKTLIRLILNQMWSDYEKEKEMRADEGDTVEEFQSSEVMKNRKSHVRLTSALQDQGHLSSLHSSKRSFRHNSFSVSFRHDPNEDILSGKNISYFLRNLLSTYYYIGYIILIVLGTASTQIYCTNLDNCSDYWGAFIAVQFLLSFDIVIRVVSCYPTYKSFFDSFHNIFDFVMVMVIWIPIYYAGYGSQIAESARIVYLLRLLPLLSWITDLQIIMLSIESSIRPLLYVVGMMFLMFFHFAVAGVLIFKKNDEFYFGTLYRAMNSLFQVCTLDNWGNIALKNMYGCDLYGPAFSLSMVGEGGDDDTLYSVDEQCNSPSGLGWIAAWYFLVFITLSVMVLESLFVGIIISAMELLKDSVAQEAMMWKVINVRVDKYGLQNSTVVNLLDLFNALDCERNGMLSERELDPIMKFLPPMNLTLLISQLNCQIKGNLNFAEFIDLVHLIGIRVNAYKAMGVTSPSSRNIKS